MAETARDVEPKNVKKVQASLRDAINRGRAHLKAMLDDARRFERQKLGQKQQKNKDDEVGRQLLVEIAILKSLDMNKLAEQQIYKNLVKTPTIAKTGLLPPEVKIEPTARIDKATADIMARLFMRNNVRNSTTGCMKNVKRALGLDAKDPVVDTGKPRQERRAAMEASVKAGTAHRAETEENTFKVTATTDGSTSRKRKADDEAAAESAHKKRRSDTGSSAEDNWSESEEFSGFDEDVSAGGDSSDEGSEDGLDGSDYDSEALAQFDDRFASSSDDEDDEGGEERRAALADTLRKQLKVSQDKSTTKSKIKSTEPPEATSASEDDTKSDANSESAAEDRPAFTTTGASAFLPSLSGVGYFSGSDSEATDIEEHVAPRKNRRGQRARQAIWEQKYKEQAKHLKKEKKKKDKRDEGWDMQKGAVDSSSKKGGKGRKRDLRFKTGPSGANGVAVSGKRDGGKEGEGKKGKEKHRDDDGALHPSWEAKKHAKQQSMGIGGFAGKKMTFD